MVLAYGAMWSLVTMTGRKVRAELQPSLRELVAAATGRRATWNIGSRAVDMTLPGHRRLNISVVMVRFSGILEVKSYYAY